MQAVDIDVSAYEWETVEFEDLSDGDLVQVDFGHNELRTGFVDHYKGLEYTGRLLVVTYPDKINGYWLAKDTKNKTVNPSIKSIVRTYQTDPEELF